MAGERGDRFQYDGIEDGDHGEGGSVRHLLNALMNVIWLVLAGFWLAAAYTLAAIICFVLIITIPFGVAALRIALFALWPFGRTVVRRESAGGASFIGNVLWLILCGWWLALLHVISGVLLCLTIIGLPIGLANFKLIPVSLLPFGREIVSIDKAREMGLPASASVSVTGPRP